MAANSRESRRRKILERGSDRLAFIAGRTPPPSQLHHAPETDSSKPLVSDEPRLSDRITGAPFARSLESTLFNFIFTYNHIDGS